MTICGTEVLARPDQRVQPHGAPTAAEQPGFRLPRWMPRASVSC